MSKSWTILISLALFILIVVTAYDFVQSISGKNSLKNYQVVQIEGDLGGNALKFLNSKKGEIYVAKEDI